MNIHRAVLISKSKPICQPPLNPIFFSYSSIITQYAIQSPSHSFCKVRNTIYK